MELVVILALLAFLGWREWSCNQERQKLLQRLQAPEIAVREFAERPERKPVVPVPVDDDAAYAAARERRLNGDAN